MTEAAASSARPLRLVFAALGAFVGVTIAWIACAVTMAGDAFPPRGVGWQLVLAVAWVAGLFVGLRVIRRTARMGLVVVALAAGLFWWVVPNGWWALPPPRPHELQVR